MISIGIHIKKDSICFAGLSLEEGKPKLHFFEEQFFENQNSKEEKSLFISRYIEEKTEKYKEQTLRFCYGLSQNFVTSFFIEFPFKEKFKILKTLPFEIEDQSPFRSDKIFFDARICKIKDKNKSSVICFVTPEDNIEEFLEFSGTLKNPPYLLSCEGSALANLLESWNKPLSQIQNPMTHSLYVYLGMNNSQLLLYKKGHLTHVSVLDWSINSIIKEMKKLYSLSTEKAWEEFFNKSFILTETKGFTKEQVFFSNLIKKQVNLLIPQVNLLKISLETEQEMSISDIAVFGPGSVIKNLTAFLTAETSIKCSRLKPLADFSNLHLEDKPSAYMALGLALEGLKSSPYQGLNFLQSLNKETFSFFPKKLQKASLIGLLCFLIFTAYAFVRKEESIKVLDKVQSVFVDYGKKVASLPESQISVESLKSFLKKEREKIKNEQVIQEELKQANPMDQLQLIVQKLGPASKWSLSIHYLKIEKRTVEMKGLVNTLSLADFKSQLQDLAQGNIKDHSLPQGPKKPQSDLGGKDAPSSSVKGKERIESKGSDLPGNKNLESLKSDKGLKPDEQAFFSYSFQLKEEF